MEYCKCCGAVLVDDALSYEVSRKMCQRRILSDFCPECGEPVQKESELSGSKMETDAREMEDLKAEETPDAEGKKERAKGAKRKWKQFREGISSKIAGRLKKTKPETAATDTLKDEDTPQDCADDGYDGYYDDILPADAGQPVEGPDKTLLKKVALILCGTLLAALICAVIMYFL